MLVATLLAALASTPAAAKPGKLLDKGTDTGFPIAYARGFAKSPKALLVRVSGTPKSLIEVRWQVTCRTGGKKAKVPAGEFNVTPTKLKKLKKGKGRPDDCTVDVQAAYVDAGIEGKIKIELFVRKRK